VSHRQPQAPPATGFFFVGALDTIPDWPRSSALAANSPLPIRRTIVGHLREVTTMIDFRTAKILGPSAQYSIAMPDCSLASLPSLSASTCTSVSRRSMLSWSDYRRASHNKQEYSSSQRIWGRARGSNLRSNPALRGAYALWAVRAGCGGRNRDLPAIEAS
jgi:hypothetical protein